MCITSPRALCSPVSKILLQITAKAYSHEESLQRHCKHTVRSQKFSTIVLHCHYYFPHQCHRFCTYFLLGSIDNLTTPTACATHFQQMRLVIKVYTSISISRTLDAQELCQICYCQWIAMHHRIITDCSAFRYCKHGNPFSLELESIRLQHLIFKQCTRLRLLYQVYLQNLNLGRTENFM